MAGFTKLVPEIVQSSIWNETPETRCVWITLLATKDKDGFVRGNIPSLSRSANIPIADTETALQTLLSPDASSRTTEHEGRRIEAAAGGWNVLNHALYRAKDYKEHEAERKKEYRKKATMSGTCPGQVPDSSVSVSVSASVSDKSVKGDSKGGDADEPKPKPKPKTFKTWTAADLTKAVEAANTDGLLWPNEVQEFIDCWTEPTASGRTRMSLQRTWDTRRRMSNAVNMIYSERRTKPGYGGNGGSGTPPGYVQISNEEAERRIRATERLDRAAEATE